MALLPKLQIPDLFSQQELLNLHLGPLPCTAAEMLGLLEMAVRLEARLCDAQLNGEADPILGYVVPVGSYPPSPSHLFHASIRIPRPIHPPIPVHAIEDEDMEDDSDNLADLEEDWLVKAGLGPPPSPILQPLFVPEFAHDWPDAVDLDGPNSIIIGSDGGSTTTDGDIGDWGDDMHAPVAVNDWDANMGFHQIPHMG